MHFLIYSHIVLGFPIDGHPHLKGPIKEYYVCYRPQDQKGNMIYRRLWRILSQTARPINSNSKTYQLDDTQYKPIYSLIITLLSLIVLIRFYPPKSLQHTTINPCKTPQSTPQTSPPNTPQKNKLMKLNDDV